MPPRKGSTTEKKQTKRKKPSVENSDESSEEEVLTKKSKKKEAKTSSAEANSEGPLVDSLDFSCDCKTSEGEPWNFKITAWNINGIRAWINKNGIDFLKKEDPDIFCVMETKCSTEKMPAEVEVNGYTTYWLSGDKEGYSGVGIYTKTKPINVTYGIGLKKHDEDGRVITAEYNKFYLVAAYVPNAGRKLVRLDYRMQWDVDFRNYLITLDKKKPLILCGDLNVAHQEIDLKNPKTNKKTAGFTQEERDGFTKLLENGFVDSFRHLHPDEKDAYTFWTYMMNARAKNVGWRLDYFVLSKALLPSLCENVIRKDVYGSDHCPLTLFLAL